MFSLNSDQKKRLAVESFLQRARNSLRQYFKKFAELNLDFQTKFVTIGYERARAYGLESERAVMTYLINCWILGPDFELRHPEAKAILEQLEQPPDDRARALHHYTARWLETNSTKVRSHE
jgi:hypothetical protein